MIIDINNLTFSYNGDPVLQDVNLSIGHGDFTAVIGPNGGGKTTLLKLMLGLLKPDTGEIFINGKTPRQAAPVIGYVPQDIQSDRRFPITVMDMVLMGTLGPGKRWKRHSADDRKDAFAALEKMGMAGYAEHTMGTLSGGQCRRVLIARALMTKPILLLLDEPTSGIDARGQSDFYRLMENLNRDMTLFMVSHDLMAISRHVKSVACVNKNLHYHDQAEITGDMLEAMYPCAPDEVCPVELVAHGLPHRVLKEHNGM